MTITDFPARLVDEGGGADRAGLVTGLVDLAAFLATHPCLPLPGTGGRLTLSIPVPQGYARGSRLEALREIADRMGVQVSHEDGCHVAKREFGPVTLRAHIQADDFTEELIRAAGRRNAEAERPEVPWIRCDSDEALAAVSARWAARGQVPDWKWRGDERTHVAYLRDGAGRVTEVAYLADAGEAVPGSAA